MQTFNWAIFPMKVVSLDGKMVNVCVCNSILTPTLSGISWFFRARKSKLHPPKSGGARTPIWVACLTKDVLQKMRDDTSFRSFYDVVLLKSKGCSSMTKENSRAEKNWNWHRRANISCDPLRLLQANIIEATDLMMNAIDQTIFC